MASKSKCIFIGTALLSLVIPSLVAEGAEIKVGNIVLNADSKNELAEIYVTGGESLYSLDFCAQVGDGTSGPRMLFDNGTGPVPGIDLRSGIFSVNNLGQNDLNLSLPPGTSKDYVLGFEITRSAATADPEVIANGLLAKVYFDTTGLFAGTWDFRLTDVAATTPGTGRDTKMVDFSYNPVDLVIYNGTITIVPEPSTLLLALSGLGLAGAVYAARRRAGRSRS